MRIMYPVLLLIMLVSMILAKKGGESLTNSPYVLEKVSKLPAGYEKNDTSQVWKVTFVSLRYSKSLTNKDLDSLYSEAFVCMDQFIFFAEWGGIILSDISCIEGQEEGEAMSFLFSVSKKVDKEKLTKILEESFFGPPTKKADACRLFPF